MVSLPACSRRRSTRRGLHSSPRRMRPTTRRLTSAARPWMARLRCALGCPRPCVLWRGGVPALNRCSTPVGCQERCEPTAEAAAPRMPALTSALAACEMPSSSPSSLCFLFFLGGGVGPAASDVSRARVWRAHAPLAAFALALAYISYLPPAGKAQRRRARPAQDARQPSEAQGSHQKSHRRTPSPRGSANGRWRWPRAAWTPRKRSLPSSSGNIGTWS